MAAFTAIAAGVGAVASGVGAAVGASKAQKEARRARSAKAAAQAELDTLKAGRQTVINPYESTTDLSGLATDLIKLNCQTLSLASVLQLKPLRYK